ncbi:MAG: extracellular matrix/biofilm biosynthesis regulator RemA family protein [Chloroflexota bacterium]
MSGPRQVLHKPSGGILPVGGSNFVTADRVLGVFEPSTAAVKRLIREAKTSNKLIDVSRHREVRAVLILDTGDVVTSFLTPEDLASRLGGKLDDLNE